MGMALQRSALGLARDYEAPRSQTERRRAEIWRASLDLDDGQVHDHATSVAMRTVLAICRHVTPPYPGRVDILATGDRALQINRPDWPWRKELLAGPWTLAKLDCLHQDLFSSRAGTVFEWMKARLQTLNAPQSERAGAQP
jgi:hypothetical protein